MSDDIKKPEEEKKSEVASESNKAIVDVLSKVADSLVKNSEVLAKIEGKIDKALETPNNYDLKPATTDSEDIGAKVKVPDTYQSNSQQASIDDSDPKNTPEKDPSDLKMQEKKAPKQIAKQNVSQSAFEETSTPRPTIDGTFDKGLTPIEKAYGGTTKNPILDDLRKMGLENANKVASNILKGNYYHPEPWEVGR